MNFAGLLTTVNGNLTIQSVGSSGTLAQSATTGYTLTIGGDFVASHASGTFSFGTGTVSGGANVNLGGSYNHSGAGAVTWPAGNSTAGAFQFTGGAASVNATFATGAAAENFSKESITIASGKTVNQQTAWFLGGTATRNFTNNGTLNLGANKIFGANGTFILGTGATLGIGHPSGMSFPATQAGTITSSTSSQTVTGM
jgi:hypothetical protein